MLKGSQLMRRKPYKLSRNGSSACVAINPLTGLLVGDRVYQFKNKDGSVLLIPEDLYNEKYN